MEDTTTDEQTHDEQEQPLDPSPTLEGRGHVLPVINRAVLVNRGDQWHGATVSYVHNHQGMINASVMDFDGNVSSCTSIAHESFSPTGLRWKWAPRD